MSCDSACINIFQLGRMLGFGGAVLTSSNGGVSISFNIECRIRKQKIHSYRNKKYTERHKLPNSFWLLRCKWQADILIELALMMKYIVVWYKQYLWIVRSSRLSLISADWKNLWINNTHRDISNELLLLHLRSRLLNYIYY